MISFKVDNLINMNSALKQFADFLQTQNVTEDDVFDSRLVSCELITNVIRHCGETANFRGGIEGDSIRICVSSSGTGGCEIKPNLPDVFAESGRGLYIINVISDGKIKVEGNEIIVTIKLSNQ